MLAPSRAEPVFVQNVLLQAGSLENTNSKIEEQNGEKKIKRKLRGTIENQRQDIKKL